MKKLPLTLLILTNLIGTASALTFSNNNGNSNDGVTNSKLNTTATGIKVTGTGTFTTTDPNAVCNNGDQATYVVKRGSTNKWAVILYGGAGSRSADQHKKKGSSTKRPGGNHSFTTGPERDLIEKGYNMVFIHSCTNDGYQGNHYNVIDGKKVPFRGRVVVEDVIRALYDELNNADEVIFAGYSSGAGAIGFHAPLIGEFDNVRVIIDSFWYSKADLDHVRPSMLKPENMNKHNFQFRSSNELCDGNFVSCFPSRENFQKNGIEDVFLIWNIGDGYSHADRSAVMKATKSDIEYYGAGYSIRADERKIRGLGRGWGHVMAFGAAINNGNDTNYKKKYFKMSLQEALNNWIDKKGDAIVIDYYNTQTTASDSSQQEVGGNNNNVANNTSTSGQVTSRAKTKETETSKKFESSIKKNGKVVFEGVDQFTKFDIGIPLGNTGALLVGFKDLKVLDDKKVNVRAHIKYGNIDFSVGICFEYYSQHTFMAARTSFGNKDWGGLKKVMSSSRCIGAWELNGNKSKLEELGVYAVMEDIQKIHTVYAILRALDNNSTIDLSKIRSFENK